MYFKITMFWIVLNIFLMISAISQVRGLNQNSSNISKKNHQTKNEPSFLILKDIQGNMYKYIYPNDMDQFSKMSTLGNKNSSTVIHLPPGILKIENSSCDTGVDPVKQPPNIKMSPIMPGRPRTTYPKNTTNPIVTFALSTTPRNVEKDNTTAFTKENQPTETTTIKNSQIKPTTEKEEAGDGPIVGGPNLQSDISDDNKTVIPTNITNNTSYNNSNGQQNLYKSCNARNCLILLVKNDIKLKLFSNSNGILNKSSPANSEKISMVQLNDELSTDDDIMNED